MRVFVIADLHLSVDTPELLDKFRAFADEISVEDELYILGDLFNYYVGINPDDKVHAAVREINSSIISRGGKVYFIHGNRDFLLNNRDASYFKIQLLKDTIVSFIMSLVYPFLTCLIPGVFRISALKDEKSSLGFIYKLSSIIMFIIWFKLNNIK